MISYLGNYWGASVVVNFKFILKLVRLQARPSARRARGGGGGGVRQTVYGAARGFGSSEARLHVARSQLEARASANVRSSSHRASKDKSAALKVGSQAKVVVSAMLPGVRVDQSSTLRAALFTAARHED